MVDASFENDLLVLRVEGADKIWALRSELRIPLQHIAGARLDADIVHRWWHGLKVAGTGIPGVITAGTFYQDGQRVFWDVHHPQQAVVIELRDENYNELVIAVADPAGLVARLRAAL